MPTYEYRCARCGHKFEKVHRVGETVDRCERCGGPVRRVFSVPALIFKGSGFYITDHRKTPPSDGDGKAPGGAKATPDGKSSETKSSETRSSDSGSKGTASSASEGKKAS